MSIFSPLLPVSAVIRRAMVCTIRSIWARTVASWRSSSRIVCADCSSLFSAR